MGQIETKIKQTESWPVRAALGVERWMAGYIRPRDPLKEAKRHKMLVGSAIALALAAVVIGGGIAGAPYAKDALRDYGAVDATTPIHTGLNSPNINLRMDSGNRVVELSNPHDLAVGTKSAVINVTPGLKLQTNLDVMDEITTGPNSPIKLSGVSLAETIIVPFSLTAPSTAQIDSFLLAEVVRINKSRDLGKWGPVRSIKTISADDELYRLTALGMVPNLFEPKSMVGLPLLAPLGGGGGGLSLEEQLSQALSEKWLKKIIEISNETSGRSNYLNPDFPPDQLLRLIQARKPITVTRLNKSMFDARNMRRVFPIFTPTPQFTLNDLPKCYIQVNGLSSNRPPAEVELAIGAIFNRGNPLFVKAAKWDFNGDGIWDTPMDTDQYTPQKRTYTQPGRNTITGQLQLSDDSFTEPCSTSFTLTK